MGMKHPVLAILTHETDDFWQRRYLVKLMIPHWEELGFRVVVVTKPEHFIPADVALMHIDLSVTPEKYRHLVERYPKVINARVFDIRKSVFSRLLINQDGLDAGKVIVKTDLNCGGWREFQCGVMESPIGPIIRKLNCDALAYRWLARIETRRPWRHRRILSQQVFEKREDIPPGVWLNRNLVVERFMAERDGENYSCRLWLFFGNHEVSRRIISKSPIVKLDGKTEGISGPIPEELREIREKLGFDYGKFDYGIIDGKVVLYDVNRTPGAGIDSQVHAETVHILSRGIRDFFAAG